MKLKDSIGREDEAIARSNYSITKHLVEAFADLVEPSWSDEAIGANKHHAMDAITRHVENPLERAELASMYKGLVGRKVHEVKDSVCQLKYLMAHEADMSAFSEDQQKRCHRCTGQQWYIEKDQENGKEYTMICPDYIEHVEEEAKI